MTRKTDRLWLKTLAFILCVASIVAMAAGIGATAALAKVGGTEEADYWKNCFSDMIYTDLRVALYTYVQEKYGAESLEDSNIARYGEANFSVDGGFSPYPKVYLGQSNLRYEIYDKNGYRVARTYEGEEALVSLDWYFDEVTYLKEKTGGRRTYELDPNAEGFIDEDENGIGTIQYWETADQSYTVKGYLLKGFPYESDRYSVLGEVLGLVYSNRSLALAAAIGGFLLAILCLVYLLSAAGHRYGTTGIQLNFLDKLPLDLYTAALGGLLMCVIYLMSVLANCISGWYNQGAYTIRAGYAMLGAGSLVALGGTLVLAFLLTLATRVKYGKGYWWRRSVIGWCLVKLWKLAKIFGRWLKAVLRMLPSIWLWLLMLGALWLALFLSAFAWRDGGLFLFFSLIGAAAVIYWAMSMAKLRRNAKNLAEGKLGVADNSHLHGVFREISENMQDLGKGAERAVAERMKSERLKTELITNVSHDIKTPLTSIVNYVDLLQKPHTPEEETEYLKVLDRQSKRMKKLTEDLVEMSKASTGNIPAYLEPTNLTELAHQALAEYEEKFQKVNLLPELTVIGRNGQRLPEDARVMVSADGRLLWRVLDNLFGNAYKYALPGTRVYVDIVQYEKSTMLSVKNISRERLNISADELMERFVRGDASRNTEGSGLGLNIAKSLMDLQKADLNLVVDGDLFKAVLLYDALPEQEEE